MNKCVLFVSKGWNLHGRLQDRLHERLHGRLHGRLHDAADAADAACGCEYAHHLETI